jgi:hypothetical protein
MNVTPAHIKAAYTLLRALPPFKRWRLPPPEALRFTLLTDVHAHAEFAAGRRHCISINADTHITLLQLTESVAHEMIHLRQELRGWLSVRGDGHNAHFRRMRKQVCHALGFDVQKF